MYAVVKDNQVIEYVDDIQYVKRIQGASPQVVKDKTLATGIVLNSTIYNIVGHSDFIGAGEVSIIEVDSGKALTETKSNIESTTSDEWNETETYKEDTYVMYHNSLWICNIQNKGVMPEENSVYWTKLNIASELNRLATLINNKEDKKQ